MGLRRGRRSAEEESESDSVITPKRRRQQRVASSGSKRRVAIHLDSDSDLDSSGRLIAQKGVLVLSSDDESDHSPASKKPRKALKGKGKAKAESSEEELEYAQSEEDEATGMTSGREEDEDEDDEDDLESSIKDAPPLASSTQKQQARAGFAALRAKRTGQRLSTPPEPKPRPKVEDSEEEVSEDEDVEAEPDEFDNLLEDEDFIDDEEEEPLGDLVQQDDVSGLQPEQKFDVFVKYLLEVARDPDLSDLSESGKSYLRSANSYVTSEIRASAFSIAPSTWKAPFRYSLERRRQMHVSLASGYDRLFSGEEDDFDACNACWVRGRKRCFGRGFYSVRWDRGFYNPATHEDETEDSELEEYTRATHWKNNAEAPRALYKTTQTLVVGARCAETAEKFLNTYHFPHDLFLDIKQDLEDAEDELVDADAEFDFLETSGRVREYFDKFEELKEACRVHKDAE